MADDLRLGTRIATLRDSLGLSVEQLAQRRSCPLNLLEAIESGEIVPSLAPLIKIARALGVRLGTLLDDSSSLGPVLTRKNEAVGVKRLRSLKTGIGAGGGSLDFFSLAAGKPDRHMEPFLIAVHPGEVGPLSTHEGEELLYVLEGAIEVAYGKEVYTLGPGDSIYYDSIVDHRVRAAGDSAARLLAVVYSPF